MKEYWDQFIVGFCKVDFVCWQGEPNWLGWILISILGLILLGIVTAVTTSIVVYGSERFWWDWHWDEINWFYVVCILWVVSFAVWEWFLKPMSEP